MSMLLDILNNPWVGSIAYTRMWEMHAGSDQRSGGGPCCCTVLIYVQQTSRLYRALPQRNDSPKDVPATMQERDRQGRPIDTIVHACFNSHANERHAEMGTGYHALSPNIMRVDCREHLIEPTVEQRAKCACCGRKCIIKLMQS